MVGMVTPILRAASMTRVPSGTSTDVPLISTFGTDLLWLSDRGGHGHAAHRQRPGVALVRDLDGVHGARLVAHVARDTLGQVDRVLQVRPHRDGVRRARLGAAGAADAVLVDDVL